MSEFVAPYAKQHLFIVLHEYNSTPEPILAQAQVIRDSSFFPASLNTYVAAVSFRVSMFGNPDSGYVYQYVEPDWNIACELDDDPPEYAIYEPTDAICTQWDFRNQNQDSKGSLTLAPRLAIAHGVSVPSHQTVRLASLIEGSAAEINRYVINNGTALRVPTTGHNFALVKLTQNPTEKISGPGFGPKGLGMLAGLVTTRQGTFVDGDTWNDISPEHDRYQARKVSYIDDPSDHTADADNYPHPDLFQFRYTVNVKDLPDGFSLEHFKRYLSSGVHLHVASEYGGSLIDVLGPYRLEMLYRDEPEKDKTTLVWDDYSTQNEHRTPLPYVQCVANDGHFWPEEGLVTYFEQNDADGGYKEARTAYMKSPGDWAVHVRGRYQAYLTGRVSKVFDKDGVEKQLFDYWSNGSGWADRFGNFEQADENYWYAYTTRMPIIDSFHFRDIDCELIQAYQQSTDSEGEPLGDPVEEAFSTNMQGYFRAHEIEKPVQFSGETVLRHRKETSSFSDEPVGIYTVNELYEMFNDSQINDGFWRLQTASNGGFEIQILKKVDRFHITKSFADKLGLSHYLSCIESDKVTDRPQVRQTYILLEDSFDRGILSDFEYDNLVREDQLEHYVYFDDNHQPHKLDESDGIEALRQKKIYHVGDRSKAFRILDRQKAVYNTKTSYRTDKRAVIREIQGVECYEWENPPFPSVIGNTTRVSVESFSLFEGIQLTLPDLPFMPQITSWSNGERTLLELRLPSPYNTGNDSTGAVAATSFPYIGDLIWNVGGSGFEWLPVSSIGDLYQVTANCSLVYRDANNKPPRPLYIPQGGIFQLKVAFLETK